MFRHPWMGTTSPGSPWMGLTCFPTPGTSWDGACEWYQLTTYRDHQRLFGEYFSGLCLCLWEYSPNNMVQDLHPRILKFPLIYCKHSVGDFEIFWDIWMSAKHGLRRSRLPSKQREDGGLDCWNMLKPVDGTFPTFSEPHLKKSQKYQQKSQTNPKQIPVHSAQILPQPRPQPCTRSPEPTLCRAGRLRCQGQGLSIT